MSRVAKMMSPMHKKVTGAAGSLFSELAHALRRTIGEPSRKATTANSTVDQQQQQQKAEADDKPEAVASLLSKDVAAGLSEDVMLKISTAGPKGGGGTDIHPELTLEQIKSQQLRPGDCNHRKQRKRRDEDNDLEINTMFDFHSRMGLKPRLTQTVSSNPSTSRSRSSVRRSSVAVMAGGANRQQKEMLKMSRDYFEAHHLNLDSSSKLQTIQSSSAVHYLAISPPRIRITDDKGSVSPDMYGLRLAGQNKRKASEASEEVKSEHEDGDGLGELVSNKSKASDEAESTRRRTSSSSTTSNSSSGPSLTRGGSVESCFSRGAAGYWSSTRSR